MKRVCHTVLVFLLALCCTIFPGLGPLSQETASARVLAGANLNLPFFRRSVVTQWFHGGIDYRAVNFTPIVAANWNSTIYIRNLGGAPADVSVSFYRTTGKILDSRTYINLPANRLSPSSTLKWLPRACTMATARPCPSSAAATCSTPPLAATSILRV